MEVRGYSRLSNCENPLYFHYSKDIVLDSVGQCSKRVNKSVTNLRMMMKGYVILKKCN